MKTHPEHTYMQDYKAALPMDEKAVLIQWNKFLQVRVLKQLLFSIWS